MMGLILDWTKDQDIFGDRLLLLLLLLLREGVRISQRQGKIVKRKQKGRIVYGGGII